MYQFKKKGLKENEEEFGIKKPVFESDLIFEGIAAQLRLSTISTTFLGKLYDMNVSIHGCSGRFIFSIANLFNM